MQSKYICTIPAGATVSLIAGGFLLVAHPEREPYKVNIATGEEIPITIGDKDNDKTLSIQQSNV